MWEVQCDNCKEFLRGEDDICLSWADKETAEKMAEVSGWVKKKQKHYCPLCFVQLIAKNYRCDNVTCPIADYCRRFIYSQSTQIKTYQPEYNHKGEFVYCEGFKPDIPKTLYYENLKLK